MNLDSLPVVWRGQGDANQESYRISDRLDRYYPDLYMFDPRPEYEQDESKYL